MNTRRKRPKKKKTSVDLERKKKVKELLSFIKGKNQAIDDSHRDDEIIDLPPEPMKPMSPPSGGALTSRHPVPKPPLKITLNKKSKKGSVNSSRGNSPTAASQNPYSPEHAPRLSSRGSGIS